MAFFLGCVKLRPKLLMLFFGGLTLGNGNTPIWQNPRDPKGIPRHSMGERSDRCCHISPSFMPLLPNFALILKSQKIQNNAENRRPLKTQKTGGLGTDSESWHVSAGRNLRNAMLAL